LQTLAADYTGLGQRDEGKRFFAMNLPQFLPRLREEAIDPNNCIDDLENLLDRLASVRP
jgi:hypothetical protein